MGQLGPRCLPAGQDDRAVPRLPPVHTLDHQGENFTVRGPLNLARSPQGYPVLFMASQSEPGRELAAQHADCLFSVARSKEESIEVVRDIKGRMAQHGREPHELKIIPGIRVNVASSRDEALALYRERTPWCRPRSASSTCRAWSRKTWSHTRSTARCPTCLPRSTGSRAAGRACGRWRLLGGDAAGGARPARAQQPALHTSENGWWHDTSNSAAPYRSGSLRPDAAESARRPDGGHVGTT